MLIDGRTRKSWAAREIPRYLRSHDPRKTHRKGDGLPHPGEQRQQNGPPPPADEEEEAGD